MWFLLFSTGAVLLAVAGLPAARRLPLAPPPEALVACYFLLAALARLLVRNARLAAFERKARREARRKEDRPAGSTLGELGVGVGRGALQVVGGDLLGAGLSLATALLRGAAASVTARPPPQRERRRAARWEQLKSASCIAGVGLVCAAIAWEPLLHARLVREAGAALAAGTGARPAATTGARAAAALVPAPAPMSISAPASPAASAEGVTAARPELGAQGAATSAPLEQAVDPATAGTTSPAPGGPGAAPAPATPPP